MYFLLFYFLFSFSVISSKIATDLVITTTTTQLLLLLLPLILLLYYYYYYYYYQHCYHYYHNCYLCRSHCYYHDYICLYKLFNKLVQEGAVFPAQFSFCYNFIRETSNACTLCINKYIIFIR